MTPEEGATHAQRFNKNYPKLTMGQVEKLASTCEGFGVIFSQWRADDADARILVRNGIFVVDTEAHAKQCETCAAFFVGMRFGG